MSWQMPRRSPKATCSWPRKVRTTRWPALAQNEFYFGRSIPMQSVIDNIDAVTPADLLCLAEDLWDGGNAALTMLGPGVDGTDFSGTRCSPVRPFSTDQIPNPDKPATNRFIRT
jgi:hypothetical protein